MRTRAVNAARLWAVSPWFGRLVSAANKSGRDTAATQSSVTHTRTLRQAERTTAAAAQPSSQTLTY